MKQKVIVAKSFDQYIDEQSKKDPEFKRGYEEELAKLQVGFKIAQLRQMRHLSQAELAKKVKTTQQTISRLEDLKNARININTLVRLAVALKAKLSIDFIPSELTTAVY